MFFYLQGKDMSIQKISFRTVPKKEDAIALQTIVSMAEVFIPEEVERSGSCISERLIRGIESGYYFVFAESDLVVVGFTCFGPIADTVASYRLFQVAVRNDFQRKGIGAGLLSETEKHITTMSGRRLFVEFSSRAVLEPASLFFQNQSFIPEASLKDFFDEGDDKLIYAKDMVVNEG